MSSLFHLPTSEENGPQQRLYVYMWSGRPKAYLSRQVLFLSAHTATLFGEVESEENYCACKYCFAGDGRRSDLSYRVFLRNLTHENDLVILDFQLPLNNQTEVPGFFLYLFHRSPFSSGHQGDFVQRAHPGRRAAEEAADF